MALEVSEGLVKCDDVTLAGFIQTAQQVGDLFNVREDFDRLCRSLGNIGQEAAEKLELAIQALGDSHFRHVSL